MLLNTLSSIIRAVTLKNFNTKHSLSIQMVKPLNRHSPLIHLHSIMNLDQSSCIARYALNLVSNFNLILIFRFTFAIPILKTVPPHALVHDVAVQLRSIQWFKQWSSRLLLNLRIKTGLEPHIDTKVVV